MEAFSLLDWSSHKSKNFLKGLWKDRKSNFFSFLCFYFILISDVGGRRCHISCNGGSRSGKETLMIDVCLLHTEHTSIASPVFTCWLSRKLFDPPAVFSRLQQQLQAACQMVPNLRPVCSPERVTLFQLSVYLKRWSIQELGEHISRLSKEGIGIIYFKLILTQMSLEEIP